MKRHIALACRFVLLAVFALSVSYKVTHWSAFTRTMDAINLVGSLPASARIVCAGLVVGGEAFFVVLLAWGRR